MASLLLLCYVGLPIFLAGNAGPAWAAPAAVGAGWTLWTLVKKHQATPDGAVAALDTLLGQAALLVLLALPMAVWADLVQVKTAGFLWETPARSLGVVLALGEAWVFYKLVGAWPAQRAGIA